MPSATRSTREDVSVKKFATATSPGPDTSSPAVSELRAFADAPIVDETARRTAHGELTPLLRDVEALRHAEYSKGLHRFGAGCDRPDESTAWAHHLVVTSTPGVNSNSRADLTGGLAVSLARRTPGLDRDLRVGGWTRLTGAELSVKTGALIGAEAIGRAVAGRGDVSWMRIEGDDPHGSPAPMAEIEIADTLLDPLLNESEAAIAQVPTLTQARSVTGTDGLTAMKRRVVITDASRGRFLGEDAARCGLEFGVLEGAGPDVHEVEPRRGRSSVGSSGRGDPAHRRPHPR
ncbi:MAG: NAD(P)-dependent oxidoreductase, partial [Cellulomonas sp.]